MKKLCLLFILLGLSLTSIVAQVSCLDSEQLKSLDLKWEQALLQSDISVFESLLAEEFIWVHNHAGLIDSKAGLIERASDKNLGATGNPKSRISNDVQTVILGSTAVVSGFTIVDRGPNPITYHFMRTYSEIDGNCFLIANHTMAVPTDDE